MPPLFRTRYSPYVPHHRGEASMMFILSIVGLCALMYGMYRIGVHRRGR